ncbi:MAG: hypothetical protein RIB45_02815 [Marivibrio sp.]|uniref:hypothetical protein n=1 Tax=Marivibrio sp. TaxID=2039719 RepID=UPI0032EF640C
MPSRDDTPFFPSFGPSPRPAGETLGAQVARAEATLDLSRQEAALLDANLQRARESLDRIEAAFAALETGLDRYLSGGSAAFLAWAERHLETQSLDAPHSPHDRLRRKMLARIRGA